MSYLKQLLIILLGGFPNVSVGKESSCNAGEQETWVHSLSWEAALEEGMAAYSSVLPWRISWTEEPGGLQSMGSQRDGHN